MKIGTLMIDMAADVARLSADMNRATGIVDAASAKMSAAANMAKGALAGIAAGFTVAAFAGVIKGAIDSAAKLHDLAIQSSTTVEALSGLAAVGKFSDQTADSIAGAMNKLTRNLASTTEESRGAGLAIQALGLSVSQFKNLRPEDQMLAVAKALDGFADSADKSAVMMALYGKEGAKMLPFMQDLAVAGDLAAKVTTEQAAAADNLSDNWLRLQTSGDGWKKELAMGMVPALDQGLQALLDVTNGAGGLRDQVRALAADGSIKHWTNTVMEAVSYVVDGFQWVIRVVVATAQTIGGAMAAAFTAVGSLGSAFGKVISGDMSGALAAISSGVDRSKNILNAAEKDVADQFTGKTFGAKWRESMQQVQSSTQSAADSVHRQKPKLDYQNVLAQNAKGAKDSESAFNSLIKRLQEHLDTNKQEIAMGRELTDVEKLEVKTKTDVALAGNKLNAAQRAAIATKLEDVKAAALQVQIQRSQIAQAKELAEARAAQRRADEQSIRAFFAQQQDEQAAALRTSRERIQSIDDENAAMDLSVRANISLAEAVQRVAIARLKEKQARFHEGSEGWNDLQQQIDLANQLSEAISGAETRRRNNDMWDGFMNAAHGAFINIENGFESTVKQLWKSIKTGLLDLMWNAFAKPIMLNLRASLMGIGGGLTGTGAMAGGAGGGGGAGGLLNMGSSLFGAFGTSASWGLTNVLAGNIGSTFGGAMSMLGAGQIGSGLGALAGAAAPALLPLLALVGSGAFSRKHEQHNLQGTFGGASGFEGKWHDYYRGGLLTSSTTDDQDIDSATLNALRAAWKAQEAAVTDYANLLGLQTDRITGYTYAINLKLKDLGDPNAEGYMAKVMKVVNDAIAAGSNEMAEKILGTWTTTTEQITRQVRTYGDDAGWQTVTDTITRQTYAQSEYTREGENALATLTRLATSIKTVNGVFDTLGLTLIDASLAGGDLASKLVDAFGGTDQMGAAFGSYYERYYSEQEQVDALTRQLTGTFRELGFELPATRKELRRWIEEQQDSLVNGNANAATKLAGLVTLATPFDELTARIDALRAAAAGAGEAVDELGQDLSDVMIDLLAERQRLNADLLEAQGDLSAAMAARRAIDIAGYTAEETAAYDANAAIRAHIAALNAQRAAADASAAITRGLADTQARLAIELLQVQGNLQAAADAQRALDTRGYDAAQLQMYDANAAIRAQIEAERLYQQQMQEAQRLAEQQAQQAAQEAQRLADQQAQEAQRLAQQAAQEAQRAADEEARRQQGIMNERLGLTKQLLQLEGNTVLLRQIELEALDPSNRALQQRIWAIEDETAAAEKYKSALKDAQDFLGGFTKNIEEFIFKVSHAQADAQQSYQMAAAKFTAQMTLARGGDRDAMGGITSYADTLIGSIRRESTTGAEANLRIARVLGQLASLPKQISAEQLIVDAIVNANTSLETVLSTNFASLDANVDGLLTAGELAASGLATNTQISALMARVDANGDGMISKQELANSRLQTLNSAQTTANTSLGSITSAQDSTNSWLSQIQMADVGYSLSNINAINTGTSATVAAINKTNAQIGTFNRNYDNPVTAQFSADSPLYSIFKGIDETNTWLYKLHGLSTASIQFWIALLNNNAPVTVRSENRTPANGTVFADGGYTGPGAKWQPAGVVHKGEVVWSQADVARWGGPGIVDALRQGAPGYADGGPVAVRVPQIYVPPVGRSNEETQALLREVLAELRAQRSDDRARHSSLAEPLQRMDRRGAKWDKDGLPAERTNEAIA